MTRRGIARCVVVGVPLAAVGLAAWDPAHHGGPSLCPWRALTGMACPGCGLTRAGGALLRGRWSEAVDLHPLAPTVAAQLVVVWIIALVIARPTGPTLRRRPPEWVTPALLAINAVAFLTVWGLRWTGGSLPAA